ncbi:MAG: DUF4038 domain-containing protein [Sedimentisphaerales bacterium]
MKKYFILMLFFVTGCAQQSLVPRWQQHDFTFHGSNRHKNPFTVNFSAVISGPHNISFTTLGFYDGNDNWKIRLAPYTEGIWSLRTVSDDPVLDGKKTSLVCVKNSNPRICGPIMVDQNRPGTFIFEDGSHYFLMGYECDWLWALDMNNSELPVMKPFLDKLAANHFNHILLNAYSHDCKWRLGKTGPDDFGPPDMYAWAGTNEQPDHSRFNLTYWRHYDQMIAELCERGIVAHIMIKVYNKKVNWPANAGPEDDMYFRWLIARYAPFPNVVWSFSKEAHNEKDIEYKLSRFRLIRRFDPYHRLITNHDDDAAYDSGDYDSLLDFRSDQQHKNWHQTVLNQRQRRDWPVVNVEFGYECGPKGLQDFTYKVVQSPQEVCRRAWEIALAGGGIVYYYTYTAWDIIRTNDNPPGYNYFKNLYEFFANTKYWLMEPADNLVSKGYCLANPGKEYVIFLNQAEPFTLKLDGLAKPLKAQWFHPFTAERCDAGSLDNGISELVSPKSWGNSPVVLHIKQN